VRALHGGNFGLVHALLNGAMDSATLTFFVVELLQEHASVSVKDSFLVGPATRKWVRNVTRVAV